MVKNQYGNRSGANLRTQLTRIIQRAGLVKWPRIWHNMRASRQTELAAEGYEAHVICEWMGNSEQIGNKHYVQVTEDYFRKALGQPTMLHSDVISGPQESSAACGEQAKTTKKRPQREIWSRFGWMIEDTSRTFCGYDRRLGLNSA